MEETGPPTVNRLSHFGQGGELFAITLTNILLKVLTLAVYHFWGKTRVRGYAWSHTAFAGERFEYTGRGIELARGYAMAMAVLIPLIMFSNYLDELTRFKPVLTSLVGLAGFLFFIFFSGLATFSARRYLLSRTRWRSIRFSLSGSAVHHGLLTMGHALLLPLTLGLYLPFFRNHLTRNLLENSWFGDLRASYSGRGVYLLPRLLKMLLAVLVAAALANGALFGIIYTRGLMELLGRDPQFLLLEIFGPVALFILVDLALFRLGWLWYKAGELRYIAARTSLGPMSFSAGFTDWEYIKLGMGNTLLLLPTLGLAFPWVVVRTGRFAARHLGFTGELDFAAIAQSRETLPGSGEGLAEALDIGSI